MLDKQMQIMLEAANTLTADDLDTLRGMVPAAGVGAGDPAGVCLADAPDESDAQQNDSADAEPWDGREATGDSASVVVTEGPARPRNVGLARHSSGTLAPRGEYERQRTRESKVSTECLGRERERHDWWPVGTELEGRIGSELFTAVVVANPQVKSGRSIQVTSSPTAGKVCLTPTRAAIEATEGYRQAHNLGRGGGITNGWTFWKPRG